MEINRFEDVLGVIPTADVVEGRMVLMVAHSFSVDFGSQTDLPGVRVPATAEEANRAKYVVTWAPDNQQSPIINVKGMPSYTYALRQGFDQAAQSPFSATMYVTHPGNQDGVTIPSGWPCLAFGEGIYTFPSGTFIASASWAVGVPAIVANTAEDTAGSAGKLKYQATVDARVIGFVVGINSTANTLTVKIKD